MSYNGSGTFVINTAGQPVVSGTVISSTAFNALTADLATGLSTAITKDGQTTPTANIPMGNNKITGLAVGTAATDAATLSQVQSTVAKLLASVSGTDTITAVASPTLAAYAAGQMFYFVAAGANTGAVTLNINSLGAKSVTRDGTTALASGDIQSGEVCVVVYDGTQFQLVNGASQSASIVTENLTVNKATVLNESGGDNDTRIEGDTDANLVFVDASTDRVGVGTSSPGNKLDVAGTARISNTTGNKILQLGQSTPSANDAASLEFQASSTNINWAIRTNWNVAGALEFTQSTTAGGTTYSGSPYMLLSSSGNLGLGVTPSAWGSFFKAIDGAGASGFAIASQNVNPVVLAGNCYYDNSNWKYTTTGAAAFYEAGAVGTFKWYTAPSGTAGNTITFTQAMTLDASGNLVLGTTSSVTLKSAKTLQVYGNAKLGNANDRGLLSLGDVSSNDANCGIWRGAAGAYGSAGNYLCLGGYDGITFTTGNSDISTQTERARITSGGAVQINTTSTSEDDFYLNVKATNAAAFGDAYDTTTYGCVQIARPQDQPDTKFHLSFVRSGQQVAGMGFLDNSNTFAIINGTNNSSAGVTLTVGSTSWGTTSDERKKDIFGNVENATEKLSAWRTVYYKYKIDEKNVPQRIGLIAQDVQATVPEAVSIEDDQDGTLQLRYSEVIPVLVKAIQELSAKVAALEAK